MRYKTRSKTEDEYSSIQRFKMNTLVVLFSILGASVAQQYFNQLRPRPIAILRQSASFNPDGNFNYDFQSENGIINQAVGSVKTLAPNVQGQVMQGSYSYIAPDGTPINAKWYADETGFHIQGAHIPRNPPLPPAIANSLEIIRQANLQKGLQYN